MSSRPISEESRDVDKLRRLVPVWKPIPNEAIQRCDLPDNGGAGFVIQTTVTHPTLELVVPVKQNNSTCFASSSGSYPTPLVPPSAVYDFPVLEEKQMMNDELLCNGGGVCYVDLPTTDTNKALMYSSGKDLNELVYLPIDIDRTSPELMKPHWMNRKSMKLPRKIYQVSTMNVRNKVFCGMRMDKEIGIGELENMSLKKVCSIREPNCDITDFNFSQFIPEFLYVTDGGCLKIVNIETSEVVDKHQKTTTGKQWWSAKFAQHPRCYVVVSRNRVILYDRRATARRCVKLLKSPSTTVVQEDLFCSYASSTVNELLPYLHYIGSSHSLFLIDDRYPGHPVLTWKHQVISRPDLLCATLWSSSDYISMNSTSNDQEDVIILASRISQESVAIHVRHSFSRGEPQLSVSVSPPLHLRAPQDLSAALVKEGRPVDFRIHQHLELPLHGMCCVPLTADRRYAVVYQTMDGNLYSQAFLHADHARYSGILGQNDQLLLPHHNSSNADLDKACEMLDSMTFSKSHLKLDKVGESGVMDATNLFTELIRGGLHSHACLNCCKCAARMDVTDIEEECPKCQVPVELTRRVHMLNEIASPKKDTEPTLGQGATGSSNCEMVESWLRDACRDDHTFCQDN